MPNVLVNAEAKLVIIIKISLINVLQIKFFPRLFKECTVTKLMLRLKVNNINL